MVLCGVICVMHCGICKMGPSNRRWRAHGNIYIPQFYMDVITHACLYFMVVNSYPASATCMRQRTGLALVQIIACRLFGAKLLPEPILTYCQSDTKEQTSVKIESKYITFHSWKYIWKCHLRNGDHFAQGDMSEANPWSVHSVYALLFLYQSMLLIACNHCANARRYFTTLGELSKWVFVVSYFRGWNNMTPAKTIFASEIRWRLRI